MGGKRSGKRLKMENSFCLPRSPTRNINDRHGTSEEGSAEEPRHESRGITRNSDYECSLFVIAKDDDDDDEEEASTIL